MYHVLHEKHSKTFNMCNLTRGFNRLKQTRLFKHSVSNSSLIDGGRGCQTDLPSRNAHRELLHCMHFLAHVLVDLAQVIYLQQVITCCSTGYTFRLSHDIIILVQVSIWRRLLSRYESSMGEEIEKVDVLKLNSKSSMPCFSILI